MMLELSYTQLHAVAIHVSIIGVKTIIGIVASMLGTKQHQHLIQRNSPMIQRSAFKSHDKSTSMLKSTVPQGN